MMLSLIRPSFPYLTEWLSISASSDLADARLPINLVKEDDGLRLTCPIPGLKADEIQVTMEKDWLTISCQPKQDDAENARAILSEWRTGRCKRSIRLPFAVDAERIQASLADGVLTLTIPTDEKDRPRAIPVKVS